MTKKLLPLLLLLLAASAACRFGNRGVVTPTVPPASVTATSAPVTAIGEVAPGDYEIDLVSGEESRRVLLHFPPAYDGHTQLPLLILMHGGGGNAAQVKSSVGMDAVADARGVVVAYPDGNGRLNERLLTWNSGHCCGYALEQDVDDVAFLRLLIENLLGHYVLDPSRVYLSGMSNGAMMSYRAGAELSDIVAGIAPVSGAIGGQVEAGGPVIKPDVPSHPVAVMAFNGQQDQHVLYAGGTGEKTIAGRVDLSVAESIGFWVAADGCAATPTRTTQAGGNILIDTYSGCRDGVQVVLVTIVDGGHAWPGGRPGSVVGDEPTQDISADEMMLDFFFSLPGKDQ